MGTHFLKRAVVMTMQDVQRRKLIMTYLLVKVEVKTSQNAERKQTNKQTRATHFLKRKDAKSGLNMKIKKASKGYSLSKKDMSQ